MTSCPERTTTSRENTQSYALAPLFGVGRDEMIAHIPHCLALGMRVVRTGPGMAELCLPYRESLVGDPERGVVFGGAITTLLDQTGGLATSCSLETLTSIATLDLRIDYLRAAAPGHDLVARAECTKRTTNVVFIRGSAWEHTPDDPFATCVMTFMIAANPSEQPLARLIEDAPSARRESSTSPTRDSWAWRLSPARRRSFAGCRFIPDSSGTTVCPRSMAVSWEPFSNSPPRSG